MKSIKSLPTQLYLFLFLLSGITGTATIAWADNHNQEKLHTFPDTLDLVYRAELAMNPIVSCADPERNYAAWWQANLNVNPPRMITSYPAYSKFTEALPLVRLLCGSGRLLEVDRTWNQQLLERFTADPPQLAHGPGGGREIITIGILSVLDPDGPWLKVGNHVIDKTLEAMVDKGQWGYFEIPPGWKKRDAKKIFETQSWWGTYHGWTMQGLSQYYRLTGYEPARTAARKVAYYLKDHAGVFSPDGHFLGSHHSQNGLALHFHHNGNAMEGLSEYVLISGDKVMADFVLKCYQYARSHGVPEVGFFPEYLEGRWPDRRGIYDCEACCVADMVGTSMNLSLAGAVDLWDDLDRYVRNMFFEMQMLDDQWLIEYSQTIPETPVKKDEYADNVAPRLIGDFAGWCPFNEFYGGKMPGVMHCCLGNCAKKVYHLWLNAVQFEQDTLQVNLLLNHQNRWSTVKSYIPYEGKVEIIPKKSCKLKIRLPEYVNVNALRTYVQGKRVETRAMGRWLLLDQADANKVVTLEFDLPLSKKQLQAGPQSFNVSFKGNVAYDCDPPGERYPYFLHPEYLHGKVPMRKMKRTLPAILPFLDGAAPIIKVSK